MVFRLCPGCAVGKQEDALYTQGFWQIRYLAIAVDTRKRFIDGRQSLANPAGGRIGIGESGGNDGNQDFLPHGAERFEAGIEKFYPFRRLTSSYGQLTLQAERHRLI